MRKKHAFVLPFIFFYVAATAQTKETDSLLHLLSKAADDSNKVMLYWETGFSIVYQNPPGAIPYFTKGTILGRKLNFERGLERCYAAISTSYAFIAQYDSQLAYIDTAIFYANKVGDPDRLALVYLNRGDALNNLANFSDALKNCDTALVFAEKASNKDRLGRIYYIRADIFIAQNQYEQAELNLDKSQLYFEQAPNQQMLGMCFYNRAAIYTKKNMLTEATEYYKKAIQSAKSITDISNLAAFTSGLAQVYLTQKRFSEAEVLAGQAMTYTNQTGNIMQEAVIHDILSNIYKAKNKFPEAIGEELKAYKILDENNESLRRAQTASILAELYQQNGNITEAYKYLKISRDLNDSLVKQQFNDETAKLQTTFDVAQKNKQIQLLNKDKELQQQKLQKQRILMISAAALAILAIAGIWLLMNRNKLRQGIKELELRNRIAADLHDEVGSSLSSIHMLSQMATKNINETAHKDILSRMSNNAKETMDKMGDIVWMIKPNETEAGSLKQRMERFAYEICGSKNIELKMQLDELEKIKLSMEQRKNIYLVFKEALNNAVKYSDTQKIEINTAIHDKELILEVKDIGKGFDISIVKKGNGLDNMKNRAKELGGSLVFDSLAGKGTIVKLQLPL